MFPHGNLGMKKKIMKKPGIVMDCSTLNDREFVSLK
jgi:hypothetical protein